MLTQCSYGFRSRSPVCDSSFWQPLQGIFWQELNVNKRCWFALEIEVLHFTTEKVQNGPWQFVHMCCPRVTCTSWRLGWLYFWGRGEHGNWDLIYAPKRRICLVILRMWNPQILFASSLITQSKYVTVLQTAHRSSPREFNGSIWVHKMKHMLKCLEDQEQ